jgi:hypothetical protein
MPSPDFDSIGASQPPPHLKEWYDYELGSRYEYIEPQSAIGKIAVELHQALIDTAITLDEVDREDTGENQAAIQAYDLAEARHGTFENIYDDMVAAHVIAHGRYDIPGGYPSVVSKAVQRSTEGFNEFDVTQGGKAALVAFTDEVATFLNLESDLHFRNLN